MQIRSICLIKTVADDDVCRNTTSVEMNGERNQNSAMGVCSEYSTEASVEMG